MIPTARIAPILLLGVSLLFLGGCCADPESSEPSGTPEEIARELADLAVELGAFEEILDRGADEALAASAEALMLELGREPSGEEAARVRGVLRDALAEFLTPELWEETVVRAYAETFSAAELQAMLDFYGSPAGRRALELQGTVALRVDEDMDQALSPHIEAYIERVDEALATAFPEIGEGS